MARFGVRDWVRVRVRLWVVWYMDAQTEARFDRRRGLEVAYTPRVQAAFSFYFKVGDGSGTILVFGTHL